MGPKRSEAKLNQCQWWQFLERSLLSLIFPKLTIFRIVTDGENIVISYRPETVVIFVPYSVRCFYYHLPLFRSGGFSADIRAVKVDLAVRGRVTEYM